jgi:hypothetical protein
MNFIGFTYKGDVEAEKSKLVNVLKDLDSITETNIEEKDEEAKIQNVKVQNQGNMSHRGEKQPRNVHH